MFFLAQVKDSRSRRKIMDIIALDLNKAALEPGRKFIPAFADGIRGNPQRNRRKISAYYNVRYLLRHHYI